MTPKTKFITKLPAITIPRFVLWAVEPAGMVLSYMLARQGGSVSSAWRVRKVKVIT